MILANKRHLPGTERLVLPAETLRRMLPFSEAMGITRIADVTGLDRIGIPVVMVCRPNARSLAVAQGKGVDLASARVSGLMESIEQWHAEHSMRPLLFSTVTQMLAAGHMPVQVDSIAKLPTRAFTPHKKISWTEGVDLMSGQACWVPFELVHTDYTEPLPPGAGCFQISSNGLASGNHRLEAILHGLYEVIERDAVALWHAGGPARRQQTRVSLQSIDDPICVALLKRYCEADVAVAVWDVSSDIALPVFVVEIVDREPNPDSVLYVSCGQGCHRSRGLALSRALTEAAQSRLTYISGARDDIDRTAYKNQRNQKHITAALDETLEFGGPWCSFVSVRTNGSETFEEDLTAVLAALRNANVHQAVATDLTRPEFGIPVYRMIVPGLEGMHEAPGYVPGARAQAVTCS